MAQEMLALEPQALKAQYYYGTIVAPYDGDSKLNGLSILRDLLITKKLMLKTGNQEGVLFMRETYNTYLYYFYQTKDSEAFLNTMRQALLLEKLIDESQRQLLDGGIVKMVIPSRVAAIEMGIKAFMERGWIAVQPA